MERPLGRWWTASSSFQKFVESMHTAPPQSRMHFHRTDAGMLSLECGERGLEFRLTNVRDFKIVDECHPIFQRFIFCAPPYVCSSLCHFSLYSFLSFFVLFSKRAFIFQFNFLWIFFVTIKRSPIFFDWNVSNNFTIIRYMHSKLHFHCFISVLNISFVLNYKRICLLCTSWKIFEIERK